MTKEELIKKELARYALKPEHVYHGTNAVPAAFHKAMDEYAKQQAIEFLRHCLEAGYLRPDEHGSVQLDYNYWHESNFTKASEEIYTKFIEQQNKEQ